MSLVTQHVWTVGELVTSAEANTYWGNPLAYLTNPGANLASAGTIVPTNEFHIVTGTTTIANLSPASPLAGQQHRLLFQSGLTIQNNGGGTGNIRTLNGNDRAVAPNETVVFVYDGTYWREVSPAVARVLAKGSSLLDVVNTSALTAIATIAFPANALGPNGVVRVKLTGDYYNASGSNAGLRFVFTLGGTTLYDGSDFIVSSSQTPRIPWQMNLVVANLGAANSNTFNGRYSHDSNDALTNTTGIGGIAQEFRTIPFASNGPTSVDTTAAVNLVVSIAHNAANASLSMRRYSYQAEVI